MWQKKHLLSFIIVLFSVFFAVGCLSVNDTGDDSTSNTGNGDGPYPGEDADVIVESITIKSDTNGDLRPNKGETILFALRVRNNLSTAINAVNVTISSSSSLVAVLDATDSEYYTINANSSDNGANPGFKILISSNASPNSVIPFNYSISSINGTWEGTFNITVFGDGAYIDVLSYQISQFVSGNGDTVLNPGERAKIKIILKNTGTSGTSGVAATINSSDSRLSVVSNSDTYGTIASGLTSEGTGSYEIQAQSGIGGCSLPLTVNVSDGFGNSWQNSLYISVQDLNADLVIISPVIAGEPSGDGDLQPEPGETIAMYISIKNQGSSSVNNVTGVLSTSSPYITITDSTDTYGDVAVGQTRNGTSSIPWGYRFSISSSAQSGLVIPFTLTMTDAGGNTYVDSFSITLY